MVAVKLIDHHIEHPQDQLLIRLPILPFILSHLRTTPNHRITFPLLIFDLFIFVSLFDINTFSHCVCFPDEIFLAILVVILVAIPSIGMSLHLSLI